MRKLTLVFASVLLLAAVAYAQATAISVRIAVDGVNTDITLNARQVRLMNRQLADVNAARVANAQAPVTMGPFLRSLVIDAFKGQETQAESHEQAEACAAYLALGAVARNAIDTQLGGKSPCR